MPPALSTPHHIQRSAPNFRWGVALLFLPQFSLRSATLTDADRLPLSGKLWTSFFLRCLLSATSQSRSAYPC